MASSSIASLQARLALALPAALRLLIHHIVSEPFSCPELYSPPPTQDPELTFCESHFLSASILRDGAPVQAFAVEVLVYTTDTLTTIFVSKADSTGYLSLLNLPKGTPSPIKTVISTFLDYIVEVKRRKDVRTVLCLFARAQNQYLFPGSIENEEKHVLDDRGLIKWWCRVADPILGTYAPPVSAQSSTDTLRDIKSTDTSPDFSAQAYLVVPGCDAYETRAYFPKTSAAAPSNTSCWIAGDPLEGLGKQSGLPPRCYIPRFPDDPKARFVIDLDDELPQQERESNFKSSENTAQAGRWRSVKSISQFWELMAFRQECGAGRLVGFIWLVFEPTNLRGKPQEAKMGVAKVHMVEISAAEEGLQEEPQLPTPQDSQNPESGTVSWGPDIPLSPPLPPVPDVLLSRLPSSQPQPPEDEGAASQPPVASFSSALAVLPPPQKPAFKYDGALVLSEHTYKRVMVTLDTLDYAGLNEAKKATNKFTSSAAEAAELKEVDWGFEIVGEKLEVISNGSNTSVSKDGVEGTVDSLKESCVKGQVQTLGASVIRKKRPAPSSEPIGSTSRMAGSSAEEPTMLGVGAVRKKPKV